MRSRTAAAGLLVLASALLLAGSAAAQASLQLTASVDAPSGVCDALVTLGSDILIAATLTLPDGSSNTYQVRVSAIGGCGASSASPAGVEAVLTYVPTGRQMAVLCGNWLGGAAGGLDATTPVSSCGVYLTGDDIDAIYSYIMCAPPSDSWRRKRRLLQCGSSGNGCGNCLENCGCGNTVGSNNCFPAGATVEAQGRGRLRMDQLQVGHRVLSMDAQGRQSYQEVIFFGHKEASSPGVVTVLTVRAPAPPGDNSSAAGVVRTLRLTGRHFVPTLTPAGGLRHKYAADVALGDRVLVLGDDGESAVGEVVAKQQDVDVGLHNPYTTDGRLVVDGVLASAHSDFLLDDITPARLRYLLPLVYQAAFKPLAWAYRLLGPQRTAWLTDAAVPLVNAHMAAIQWALLGAMLSLALGAGSSLQLAGGQAVLRGWAGQLGKRKAA
ncbi:hypothetical protein ABPG75_003961 [Micractinium tetrahymenae]